MRPFTKPLTREESALASRAFVPRRREWSKYERASHEVSGFGARRDTPDPLTSCAAPFNFSMSTCSFSFKVGLSERWC